MTRREKPHERQVPMPNHTPVEVGENNRDRTRPEDWRDPNEGNELIAPQAEGQRQSPARSGWTRPEVGFSCAPVARGRRSSRRSRWDSS
jgi:hypothetical protein